MNKLKKHLVIVILIFSVALVVLIVLKTDIGSEKDDFKTAVYKTETGFGYSISYNNKVLIKQDFIPVIQNNQSFCNFDDAQKVADLVKEKLHEKENPKVSLQELKKLNIQLNCKN